MPKFVPDLTGGYILTNKGEYMCEVEDGEGEVLQVPSDQVDDNCSVGHQVAFREPPCQSCNSDRFFDQSENEYYCPMCE